MLAILFLSALTGTVQAEHAGSVQRSDGGRAITDQKPFERALVMTGGGLNIPAFVGVLEGLENVKAAPTLILGGCGAASALGLIHVEPDPEKRRAYLRSSEFHRLLREMTLRKELIQRDHLAQGLVEIQLRNAFGPSSRISPVFQPGFADLPQEMAKSSKLDTPFKTGQKYPVIIMAARVLYDETDVGSSRSKWLKNQGPLFEMTYFTDPGTAKLFEAGGPLADFDPNAAFKKLFGNSAPFASKPAVVSDERVSRATRGSVADPFYIDPAKLGRGVFISGAADHHPFELAQCLANEVVMVDGTQFSQPERVSYMDIFGFDIHARHASVRGEKIHRIVDFTDFGETQPDGFNPDQNGLNIFVDVSAEEAIKSRVPDVYGEEFQNTVEKLIEYGRARGEEAGRAEPFSRKHIRHPND